MDNIKDLIDKKLLKIYQSIKEIIKHLNTEKESLEKLGEEDAW